MRGKDLNSLCKLPKQMVFGIILDLYFFFTTAHSSLPLVKLSLMHTDPPPGLQELILFSVPTSHSLFPGLSIIF